MEISIPALLRIKPEALHRLGKYLRIAGFSEVALFYGEGIENLFGEKLRISFASSDIRVVHHETVDDTAIEAVLESALSLPPAAAALVAIGGGKVIDYCKYIAFITRRPVFSVPTAISNDGFASPLSSLRVRGGKRTLRTVIPHGVIVDTAVVAAAPPVMLLSGIGDLVSNLTAIADWKLAFHEANEPVNDFAVLVARGAAENLLRFPDKTPQTAAFAAMLAGALVMSGVAMEIAGTSRPASGSEHLISHAYDTLAARPSLHGIQVGVATLGIAWLQGHYYEEILQVLEECGFCDWVRQHPLEREPFLAAVEAAPGIKQGFHTILSDRDRRARLLAFLREEALMADFLA